MQIKPWINRLFALQHIITKTPPVIVNSVKRKQQVLDAVWMQFNLVLTTLNTSNQ